MSYGNTITWTLLVVLMLVVTLAIDRTKRIAKKKRAALVREQAAKDAAFQERRRTAARTHEKSQLTSQLESLNAAIEHGERELGRLHRLHGTQSKALRDDKIRQVANLKAMRTKRDSILARLDQLEAEVPSVGQTQKVTSTAA